MPAPAPKATMCALPDPRQWNQHTPDATHAVWHLPVDLAADHMAGHYPGYPILPGVVVIDWVLQALEALHPGLQLRSLDRARFVRPLLPGDVLELTLHVHPHTPDNTTTGSGTVTAKARIVRSDRQPAAAIDATFTPAGTHA